jgi:hypothetical protein
VVDDSKPGEYDSVAGPVFGPRSAQVAYGAQDGHRSWIVCGTKKSDDYDHVSEPVFAVDGKSLGFGARKGNRFLWVVLNL